MRPELKLFVLYHTDRMLAGVPDLPNYTKINVSKLVVPYSSNLIGEGRAFLADLDTEGAEYVGIVNARWDIKYPNITMRLPVLGDWCSHLIRAGALNRQTVFAPWPTDCRWLNISNHWFDFTIGIHPTMRKLLYELEGVTGMRLRTTRRTFWANDFICHRLAYFDFLAHWRKCFQHFHSRYGYLLPMSSYGIDASRAPAYFYERCSTIFWANRTDLNVVPIP